ncbi:SPTCS protein, partial [Polypterus senegalus]
MGSLEVLLSRWPNYKDVVKAKVCPRGSGALGCLTADGTLRIAMLGTGTCEHLLDGVFKDFVWEDMISSPADGSKLRLLCVSVHNDLAVYKLNAHTFSLISQCSEDDLRTQVVLKDLCLPSSLSLQLLSFANKHAFVLLNSCILVQISFSTPTHLEILGFYNLNLAPEASAEIDLIIFSREHPQDLLCRHVQEQLPLKRDVALDEDSLESAAYSAIALGLPFKTESHGGQKPTGEFSDMANSQSLSVMHFKDYKEHTAIAVSASEFSVFVLFISNDKSQVTVALWDLLANEVAYHPLCDSCVTAESSGEEQLCIILKESGLSMILFGLTQEDLLNRLIIYGSAGTVDSLCHLNGWGRCSIPIPALEAGLKNRQLDTVDFFLKSKKNILSTSITYSVPESSLNSSYVQLESRYLMRYIKSLTPALNLLSSAIKDNDLEAQSKQFSEQLLNITLSFLNKQVREIIERTQELDDHMQQCIDILSSYISELRTFMKKFPRFSSSDPDVSDFGDSENLLTKCNQRWKSLPLHEFIQDAIMSNQIPLAQAYLRQHHDPAHCLDKLLKIGLNLVFQHLQQRKVTEAGRLLRNMGYDVNKKLHTVCFYTDDKDLRDFLAEHLQKQNHFSEKESSLLEFIKIVERQLLPSPRTKSTQVVCGTGLNLSNCPILADEVLYAAHPWFELLVRFQEITKNPKDPYVIFQSSLTNSHILIPGSQASVSSMLLEGHTLLALATLMFAPGGFDEVVGQKDGEESSWKVDPQLLKMALAPYPKLKSALFPQNSSRGIPAPDISIYNLIQFRLFIWSSLRSTGRVASPVRVGAVDLWGVVDSADKSSGEMPHFASIDLVNKYAVAERLDYLHYLHHGRPSFAFGTFLVQQLSKTNSAIQAIKQAFCEAYGLGLLNFDQPVIAAACVCFCELLGVDSLKLRVDLQVGNLIFKHWTNSNEVAPQNSLRDSLAEKLFKLVDADKQSAEDLLTLLEEAIQDCIERSQFSRTSHQSSLEWALAVQFCRVHELALSTVYLQHCAWDNEFLQFLIFIQLHNYDSEQVKSLLKYFSPVLQEHLSLAFENLQLVPLEEEEEKKCLQDTDALKMSLPRRKAVPHELFHVLLLSQDKPRPWRYLLCEAISHNCPVLSVLAACEQESPMVFMLEMYEQCSEYKDYTAAKCKLFEFQKCLINLKSQNSEISFPIPVQWLESHALLLPFLILQQCQTQYELRKVLQLLADTDSVWRCHGPDFKKLSILSQILQDTTILIDLSLPKNYSIEALQKECQKILEQLLEARLFALARQVADLADLPIDRLVINQLLQELQTLKERKQWERRETRISFWKKCNSQFQSDSVRIVSVTEFFMAQAEAIPQVKGSVSEVQLTNIQEKRLLLTLAGHWLSQQDPTPIGQLEAIEKKIWECCIYQQTLLNKFEPANIFFHHVAVAGDSSYDTLIKEYSFSKLTVLNCPKYLHVEGLPVMDSSEIKLDTTEKQALAHLIGQLLDEGSIHEASRICRYFDFYNQDVILVLYCRALASGEVDTTAMHPGVQIILTAGCTAGLEKGTRRSRMSSSEYACVEATSLTSSSSFVVVSQPEDQVISDLQILTDECHHGNNYCRQVLSLYELSKELNCSYSEISAQEPKTVLRKVLSSAQPDRFKKAQAFITIQGMGVQSVAELVACDVLQALLASNQDLDSAASHKPIYNPEDGREAFLQLARLSQDPNIVGSMLLDKISCVPHGELACTVELLILAHDCYTMTCNMEGIVRVLQAARHLSHNHLAPSEQYSLMVSKSSFSSFIVVRLLTGIGRYNDMTYIFDLLYQNHRFEILLRKKVPSNTTLKTALLDYIKRCHPGDSEKHNMVALCFSMCREIGENHEGAARTQLKLIESQPWVTPELKKSLMKVLTLLKDAAESYSKDSCVRQALRCIKLAKLVTLQIHFLNINQDRRLINLARQDLMDAMISLPHFYQALVVAEAYDFVPDWAEIVFQQVVVRGDFSYLEEFKQQRPLQASLLEEISKKFKQPAESTTGQNLIRLLKSCDDVYMRYKVAYEHKLFGVANALLQDPKTSCYLNDKLAS